MAIRKVELSRRAQIDIRRLPRRIVQKLLEWAQDVRVHTLEEVRKVPGYHDEPLSGQRGGQRSIRLSRSYRAIYIIKKDGSVEFARVEEVSLHDY